MKKTIIFLSRKSLFLDFSKECFKAEGHDFFDFETISEFENQLTDLKPHLFLVDIDNTTLEDAEALKEFNRVIENNGGYQTMIKLDDGLKASVDVFKT